MILALHDDPYAGTVLDFSQWSVYTCERNACHSCQKEEIPAENETMAIASTFSMEERSLASPLGLRIKSFA
jgi:hypothetical protein